MRERFACAGLAASLSLACGSNAPEVPKELLASDSGCAAPDYPTEGLGKEPGQVVANVCFVGYRAPDRVAPTEAHRETIAFSDYYDPAGTKGVSLLLINTAAIWCTACVDEHRTLPAHASELGPKGLVILSTLFQDAKRDPASFEDVERWIANFRTNFPMVADPQLQLDGYAPSDSAPLNMVVDPRSMKLLRKYVGNQSTKMWPYIETELEARSASR
jgi:hypothetical protein